MYGFREDFGGNADDLMEHWREYADGPLAEALQSYSGGLEHDYDWRLNGASKTLATAARSKILSGNRKAASSSFISSEWFDSDGTAGLDLLAMRPVTPGAQRRPVDFEPARNYLCYLDYESLLFFSGFTSDTGTLAEQVPDLLRALANAYAVSGVSWSKVVKLSIFLQRSQKLELRRNVLLRVPS
jgi:hypothetical protein